MSDQNEPRHLVPTEPDYNSVETLASETPSTVTPPPSLPESSHNALQPMFQWRCQRCGSPDLASAYLIDYGDKFRHLRLAPKALKLPRLGRMFRPFRNLVRVNAQVCRQCGAVTLEVDPDEFADAEDRYGRR